MIKLKDLNTKIAIYKRVVEQERKPKFLLQEHGKNKKLKREAKTNENSIVSLNLGKFDSVRTSIKSPQSSYKQ